MQYLFTAKQAKQLDEHAIQEVGFPGAVLMEKAATVLSSVIEQSIRKDEGILFVCGCGNNIETAGIPYGDCAGRRDFSYVGRSVFAIAAGCSVRC